jgi:hypothetical protein
VEGFSRDNTSATQRLRMNSGPGLLSPSEGLVPSSWLHEEQCTCIQSPCGFRSTDPHFAECRNIAAKKKEVKHHSSQCIMNLEYTCHESKQACSSIPPSPKCSSIYKYSPSGSPSLFVFKTRSLAARKSAICTRILRSLNAINPASEQIALISAPDRSSFWLMNSSKSTSSFKDIFEVWRVKILRLVT